MNILCRLGLHSWKPVFRPSQWKFDWLQYEMTSSRFVDCWLVWRRSARKCRRCGKRVAL